VTDSDPFGGIVEQPLSRIRQIAGQRLHAAWTQIPHVTHHDEADITDLDARRRAAVAAAGRASLLACILHATVRTIMNHPRFGASLSADGRSLVIKQYVRLGVAIETPQGLLVGVIADADRHDALELTRRIEDLAERGRLGRLTPGDMEAPSFTITSLGGIGGTGFTPIINPPNVAILGLCQARWRPHCVGDTIAPRLLLPLSLSYDHRAIDGAEAARFVAELRATLQQPPAAPPAMLADSTPEQRAVAP
jgi:pyruvate dehydrogenase E2 component (dihydrolipoamide acetyltransferase)